MQIRLRFNSAKHVAAVVERMKGINKILRIEANAVERFVHLSVATETCAVRTFFRDLQLADAVRKFSLFIACRVLIDSVLSASMLLRCSLTCLCSARAVGGRCLCGGAR